MSMVMQAFLLSFDKESQDKYIESFKTTHKVPSYFFERFPSPFKILDARFLQKKISIKIPESESRIFIIENPTIEAQNALLKTIEELPERTYLFFITKTQEELLPTVLSRLQKITLAVKNEALNSDLADFFKNSEDNLEGILEKVTINPTIEELEKIILSARVALIYKIENNKNYEKLFNFLKKINQNLYICKTNNINKKMSLEASLF